MRWKQHWGGKECLEKFKGFAPDIVLLDVMMPDIGGWEVLGSLADNHDIHETIIIMLTAKPMDQGDAKREQIEFLSDYIEKPFGIPELVEKIGEILIDEEHIREEGKKIARSFGDKQAYSYTSYLKLATRRQRIIASIVEGDIPGLFKECPEHQGMGELIESVEKIAKSVQDIEKELQVVRSRIKDLL